MLSGEAAAVEVRDHPKAVLELFSSQGCSSCPPADLKIGALSKQKDYITLAYHVDYWDYLGWTDTFGSKENTNWQRAYAASWGNSQIYTPQLIVNGTKGVVASREKDVTGALSGVQLAVPVSLNVSGDILAGNIAQQSAGASAVVWLVTYKSHAQVAIARGENAGKTVAYTHVVTGRRKLGLWDSAAGTAFKMPLSELQSNGSNGGAILVQDEKNGLPGAIVGAASIQL